MHERDDALVERVAKALFQTWDQGECHPGPDPRWDNLPEVSVLVVDKTYWRCLAGYVVYPTNTKGQTSYPTRPSPSAGYP